MKDQQIARAFGRALREYRGRAGISQEALADAADLDRTFVSLLERGLRLPTLGTVFRLAAALEATPTSVVARASALLR